jgi:Heat shock protein
MRPKGSVLVALFIASCLLGGAADSVGAAAKSSVPTVHSLIGKKYSSVKAKGSPLIKGRTITLEFSMHSRHPDEPASPSMLVGAGCNAWGSNFRIRKGKIFRFGEVAGTLKKCKKDPDPWLSRQFKKGLKVREEGKRLVLTRSGGKVRLVFKLVASAPVVPQPRDTVPAKMSDVHGKSYDAISVIGRDLDVEALRIGFSTGTRPNFWFYVGCNHWGGDYKITDGVLAWTNVFSTEMLCQGSPDGWLGEFFASSPEIGLDGTDLVIRKDGVEIVFREG